MRRTITLSLAILSAAVLLSALHGSASAQCSGSLPSGGTSACQTRSETTTTTGTLSTAKSGTSLVTTFRALPSNSWLAVWKAQSVSLRRRGFTF
jgi:hypothetical protein